MYWLTLKDTQLRSFVILTGRGIDDFAVDQQEHRRRVVVARIGMIAAPDQEIDIRMADREYRRGQGTLGLITSVR